MVVKFVNLQQRPIKCVPSLVAEQENRIVLKSVGSYKYSPSVAAFVKARMQRLVEEVAARNGGNLTVSGMKTTLQTLEWQIGRLELLAKEVQRMISHHEGVLYRNNNGGDEAFGIRFDMGGKLRVKILLNNSFAQKGIKSIKFIRFTNVVASQRRKRLSPVLSFSQFRQLCIADRHNDAKKALEGFKNPRANLVF